MEEEKEWLIYRKKVGDEKFIEKFGMSVPPKVDLTQYINDSLLYYHKVFGRKVVTTLEEMTDIEILSHFGVVIPYDSRYSLLQWSAYMTEGGIGFCLHGDRIFFGTLSEWKYSSSNISIVDGKVYFDGIILDADSSLVPQCQLLLEQYGKVNDDLKHVENSRLQDVATPIETKEIKLEDRGIEKFSYCPHCKSILIYNDKELDESGNINITTCFDCAELFLPSNIVECRKKEIKKRIDEVIIVKDIRNIILTLLGIESMAYSIECVNCGNYRHVKDYYEKQCEYNPKRNKQKVFAYFESEDGSLERVEEIYKTQQENFTCSRSCLDQLSFLVGCESLLDLKQSEVKKWINNYEKNPEVDPDTGKKIQKRWTRKREACDSKYAKYKNLITLFSNVDEFREKSKTIFKKIKTNQGNQLIRNKYLNSDEYRSKIYQEELELGEKQNCYTHGKELFCKECKAPGIKKEERNMVKENFWGADDYKTRHYSICSLCEKELVELQSRNKLGFKLNDRLQRGEEYRKEEYDYKSTMVFPLNISHEKYVGEASSIYPKIFTDDLNVKLELLTDEQIILRNGDVFIPYTSRSELVDYSRKYENGDEIAFFLNGKVFFGTKDNHESFNICDRDLISKLHLNTYQTHIYKLLLDFLETDHKRKDSLATESMKKKRRREIDF